jgi:hypothetical protein
MMMMIFKVKYKIIYGPLVGVNEKLWIGRRNSKIGIVLQQFNNKGMFTN